MEGVKRKKGECLGVVRMAKTMNCKYVRKGDGSDGQCFLGAAICPREEKIIVSDVEVSNK